MNTNEDQRVVLTLDAGGTNFVFSAIQANQEVVTPVRLPAETKVLERSLQVIESGFRQVMEQLDQQPVAISFAFPGPADYPNGIIDNVGNLPAFAGGVALGPFLEDRFGIPVFINNDGDLFAYGEAICGLLPEVNALLEKAGSPKRYRTLFGVTLGTGFGGGLVHNDRLFLGDNSNAGEVWLLRNKVRPDCFAEEGACIRSIRGNYAREMGIEFDDTPSPKEIAEMAIEASGTDQAANQSAAVVAFSELGQVVGDALANITTLLDGLIVIGGGISNGHQAFMQPLVDEMQGSINKYDGTPLDRIVQKVFNLESPVDQEHFIAGATKTITVPGSEREISYDPMKRVGIGVSRLGTSRAVSVGAYAFALNKIDQV